METQELDDIVQHLAVAKYALEAGEQQVATDAVDAALAIARRVLTRKHGERAPLTAEPMVRTQSAGD
jgi:hypothetical protein